MYHSNYHHHNIVLPLSPYNQSSLYQCYHFSSDVAMTWLMYWLIVCLLIDQTVELRGQEQQCAVDVSTQMTRVGCFVSCCQDKLVSPGNYMTAGEYQERHLRAVSPRCQWCCFTGFLSGNRSSAAVDVVAVVNHCLTMDVNAVKASSCWFVAKLPNHLAAFHQWPKFCNCVQL